MTVYVIRHGETAWSLSGQHTGTTDLPLTDNGRRRAERLRPLLLKETFALVLVSPMQRARQTCELAGLGNGAVLEADLVEWNYGEYEGLRGSEIRATRPDWEIFRDGCPGGESPHQVAARADGVVRRLRAVAADVLLFSSGHFSKMLAARWIGIEAPIHARAFLLSTASLSALGYEGDLSRPVIRFWNDTHHVIS